MATAERIHLETAIESEGEPPPIVLLHSLAMDHTIWDTHVAAIAGRAPVVRCDLPGHGKSSSIGPVSVEWMATQVAMLLDELPWSRFLVAGLSLGGCVAQALTIHRPDLVTALLLVDTTSWYGPNAAAAWEQRAMKAKHDGFDALSGFQLERWFGPEFRSSNPEVGSRLLDIFRANDIDSYVNTCRAMGRFDAREQLSSIEVPTRVLVGEFDPATPVADAELLVQSIPGASLRILPGAGHMSPIEYPDVIVEEVLALHGRAQTVET